MDPNNFAFPEDDISRQDRLDAEAFNPERMSISERLDRVQLNLSREAEGERLGKRFETGKHLVFALTGILTRDANLKNMLEMARQAEHADVFLDRLLVQSAVKRPWYTDTFPLPPQKDIDWFARRAQPAAGHFDMIFDYLNYHYPTEVYLLMFAYLLQRHSGPGRRLRRFSPPSMSEGQQFMEEFMGPDIPPSVTALLYSTMYDAEDSEGYPAFNS